MKMIVIDDKQVFPSELGPFIKENNFTVLVLNRCATCEIPESRDIKLFHYTLSLEKRLLRIKSYKPDFETTCICQLQKLNSRGLRKEMLIDPLGILSISEKASLVNFDLVSNSQNAYFQAFHASMTKMDDLRIWVNYQMHNSETQALAPLKLNSSRFAWNNLVIILKSVIEIAPDFNIELRSHETNYISSNKFITPFQLLKYLLKNLASLIVNKILNWSCGLTTWHVAIAIFSEDGRIRRFRILTNPKNGFFADPFIIESEQNYFVFVEECEYEKKKAKIS